MKAALARHDALLREAVEAYRGHIVKNTGDGIHAVFESAASAVAAALTAQHSLFAEQWEELRPRAVRVRLSLHTSEAETRAGDYYGPALNRVARLMSIGHGGQTLLSTTTADLVRDQLPAGASLRDLGEHGLKDLARSEHVYQLVHPALPADFPPLKSRETLAHNLPAQATPFVGREAELTELARLLDDSAVRLISIVAPGGMGKTRLALEAGQRVLGRFADGVFFVELARITDAGNIISAIAEAAGYQFQQDGRDQKRQVLDYLVLKRMLLILDNFEHLLSGAGVTADILKAAPEVHILATSRQRLKQMGETFFNLGGMDFPVWDTPDNAIEYAAVKLFLQNARQARPDFELTPDNLVHVARICRSVQGMPLGLLLAAAWMTVLSTAEIAQEIQLGLDILEAEGSELPERQRSIRVVFDYSWGMLTEAEQRTFAKLAIFRGGFTREAAQAVADAGLRQLQSLVNTALIRRDAELGRYDIHELLRQYAEENLRQSGQHDQTRRAYSAYYLNYLAQHGANLKGAGQLSALKLIEADFVNIRESWDEVITNQQHNLIEQALEAMYLFCFLQSRLEDGKALFDKARRGLAPEPGRDPHPLWLRLGVRFYSTADNLTALQERLETALASARRRDDRAEAAYCLHTLGTIAHYREVSPLRAVDYYEQSAAIYRRLGEKYYLAQTLSKLGEAYQLIGRTDLTIQYVDQAYQLQREIGDQMGESETLRARGMTTFQIGQYAESYQALEKAYAIQRKNKYLVGQASSSLYKGMMVFWGGDRAEGRALVQRGLDLALDVVDRSTQAWCYAFLSWMDSTAGDYENARQSLAKAEAIETDPYRQTGAGNPFLQLTINISKYLLDCGQGDCESARTHLLQPLRLAVMTASQPYMTILMALIAIVHAHAGRLEPAVELLGLAFNPPAEMIRWIEAWAPLSRVRAELEGALGQAAFAAAWERGKSLDLKTTAEEVLRELEESNQHSSRLEGHA